MKKKIKRLKRWVREHTKGLIIGGVVVALLAVGGYFAWHYAAGQLQPGEGELSEEEKREVAAFQQKKSEDIAFRDEVNKALESDDASALGGVKEQIDQEAEAARKVELYVELSNVYFDQGMVDESLAAAKQAEEASEDKFLVADWLSRVYEYQHDYASAIRYYTMAAEHASSPQNYTGLDAEHFRGEAKRVQALLDKGVKS